MTAPPKNPAAPAGGPGRGKKKNTLNVDNYLFTISQYVCKTSILLLLTLLLLSLADFSLEDIFNPGAATKAPPKVVPKAPTSTKAPIKPKPKPGRRGFYFKA